MKVSGVFGLLRVELIVKIKNKKFPASVRLIGAKMRTANLFFCRLHNSESVAQDQLFYSPSTGNVYRFACKLLSTKTHAFSKGFSDWKHPECLYEHEKILQHRNCMLAWIRHAKATGTVDADLAQQLQSVSVLERCPYMCCSCHQILKRVGTGDSHSLAMIC